MATDIATRLVDPPGRADPIGTHLRWWRGHRHLSQLDLAGRAEVSTRHLSFVETGRSQPSREMVLHLAERLDIPLRRRNELLLAAGYAPEFHETEAPTGTALDVLDRLLGAHMPAPAVVVDRHWNVVTMNEAAGFFVELVDPSLLVEPLNALRLT
ncbi:MAG: helix-turn-helix transcriptional regulator, partial [Actinomycetia bacterium]|nr:helix-turn-helix transcriptional regulator [Actinomycetes bacterium]